MPFCRTSWSRGLAVLLAALFLLPACTPAGKNPAAGKIPAAASSPPVATTTASSPDPTRAATATPGSTLTRAPTQTDTPQPTASPTALPSQTFTPFPRALDAYGITYDPNATAEIPFRRSASMPIWDNALPAQPVDGTPQISAYPVPEGLRPVDPAEIARAGCEIGMYGQYECAADSPLRQYPCDHIIDPFDIPDGLLLAPQPGGAVVAECRTRTDNWETSEGDGLYMVGCAFRAWVWVIFNNGGAYVLVDTPEALRQQFAPIESAAEAISYAQMLTGLKADFNPTYDPSLLYLRDHIEGTHAVEDGDGYRINLYHRPGCFCEPWVYSQVTLRVGRDGALEWTGAEPYALTTGFSCAD